MDITQLWDFGKPEASEKRFRAALASATKEEALILTTQIARTHGLRGNFASGMEILAEIAPHIGHASAQVKTYYYLELGRMFSSATHPPESQTAEVKEQARAAYLSAYEQAQSGSLDDLAVDALHMLAFVDTEPENQLKWNLKALAVVEATAQEQAKKWAASLHNNTGYALHQLGRYDEALAQFELALSELQRQEKEGAIRIAYWMIAWTYRAMNRLDEALAIQLRLEKECDLAGEPDLYVYEELELLYQALGHPSLAAHYASLRTNSGAAQD